MKKIILLTILLNVSYHLFAFTTQGVWRWRKDNGSEVNATWRADQNTSITISNVDSVLRLRIQMYNDSVGADGVLDAAALEDSTNEPGSGWNTIKLSAGTNAFVLAGTDKYVTDLQHTTHELDGKDSTFVFDPGYEIVSTESYPTQTVDIFHMTEIEYVIKPSPFIKPGLTYYFRLNEAYFPAGYKYPFLITAAVLPVSMSSFTIAPDKNKVQINWSTAIEENCNRFDIERSTDGFRFLSIATVQGNGTTAIAHNYSVYDEVPSNGANYYRIKQYDNDGRFAISGVKSINMVLKNVIAKAYPNPTHADINFMLQNYAGSSVTATLIDVTGKPVHKEVIQTNAGQINYKLNLKTQLAAGVYILQLKGDSLSESIHILIQ
jgi:hypothetical protein